VRTWRVRRAPVVLLAGALLLTACAASPSPGASPSASRTSPAATSSSATASPSTTAPSPPPAAAWAARVAAENALAGTGAALADRTRLKAHGLDAYADRVSVLPGQDVGLYVSTRTDQPVRVTAYRVGWYGGAGFRAVWHGTARGTVQASPVALDQPLSDAGGASGTKAVVAPWRLSGVVPTTGWPEGMYVLRVDGRTASRLVPVTVRSADATGRLLVLDSPMTWQAYNAWGGRGLYGDESKAISRRSLAVSFDRPYDDGYGAGRFFTYVAPLLREAERLGLPLAWATDYDVALDPGLLHGASGVVIGSHQEYWTAPEWEAVVAAARAGTNVAFFGANTAYWRVRLAGRSVALAAEPSRRDGRPRIVFGPKDARLDPLASTDPSGATARFRDQPFPRAEERLTGLRYDCYPVHAAWVVSDASWWGYAGTGLRDGSQLPGLIGPESDRLVGAADLPRPMQVVAQSPTTCRGHRTVHAAVYWSTPAGAGVFTAGTMGWAGGLVRADVATVVRAITDNVLRRFAQPHAGASAPPRDDIASVDPPSTVPAPPP
jgi:hypothetical protein